MKKISPLLIIANRYIAFLALLFVIMSSNSCKRIDIVKTPVDLRNSKFFKANKPVSTHINSVIEKLKDFNNKTGFVEKLDDKKGLPVWDKIVFKKNNFRSRGLSDSLEEYIVPVTENDKSLSSLINIKELIDGNFLIENYTANDYLYKKIYEFNPDLEKMEGLLVTFFFMENETFGNKEFFNIPAIYFPESNLLDINGNRTITIKDIEPNPDNYYVICIPVVCPFCKGDDPNCPLGRYWTECTFYFGGGSGSGGGGGSGYGGSSGGGNPGGSGSGLGGSGGSAGGGGTPPPLPPCPGTAFYRGEPAQTIGGAPVCDPNPRQQPIGKNLFDTFSGDEDNNSDDNFDLTNYGTYQVGQQWPVISNVIQIDNFVGWGASGISENCMSYAKAQIAKKGYKISNYGAPGQTIQIYKSSTGGDINASKEGVAYLLTALQSGIPVIVGVDDKPGSSNPQTDNTTDHFVVIVGTGTDSNGNYFTFYDNASSSVLQGANSNNKFYYNILDGLISGYSQTDYAKGMPQRYIVTMIRKSK